MAIKYKNNFRSFAQRLYSFPKKVEKVKIACGKSHCKNLYNLLIDNFYSDTLGMEKLAYSTIEQKEKLLVDYPENPLLRFHNEKNSMVNGLRITGKGKKWKLAPSRGNHHSGIKLSFLWTVHEFGAVRMTKNGVVVLPARRPLRRTLKKYYKSIKYNEENKFMVKALGELAKSNDKDIKRIDKELDDRIEEKLKEFFSGD